MKRLTSEDIKKALSNKFICYGSRLVGKQFFAKMCNELIEYKNIEEELGIDLITLFKALKNGIYIYANGGKYVDEGDCSFLSNINTINYSNKSFISFKWKYYFKDYGKTWALTKEELEK